MLLVCCQNIAMNAVTIQGSIINHKKTKQNKTKKFQPN